MSTPRCSHFPMCPLSLGCVDTPQMVPDDPEPVRDDTDDTKDWVPIVPAPTGDSPCSTP